MDTGVLASHVEFEGRAELVYNSVGDGINTDCLGHGTHVAGLIASRTYGVAKKATILAVKVLNCKGEGQLSGLLTAGEFIIADAQRRQKNGTRRVVINLSLGGPPSTLLDMMVQTFVRAGMVVAAAAGNDANDYPQSPDACDYSPSRLGRNNQIMTIGSSDANDERTFWSNYGECVSAMTPGDNILSLWIRNNFDTAVDSGTSMSTPLAAGVAAMVLHQRPDISVADCISVVLTRGTPDIVQPVSVGAGQSLLLYSYIDLSAPFAPYTPPPSLSTSVASASAHSTVMPLLALVLGAQLLWLLGGL